MSDTTTVPAGEIGMVDAALSGDAKALAVLRGVLGPSEEEWIERPNGERDRILHHGSTGSSLRLRDGALIVARLQVHDDGQGAYPRPASIVEGISASTTRSEVRALLGTPRRESQFMDLYLYGEHYLRIDYVRGGVDSISMTIAGVEE